MVIKVSLLWTRSRRVVNLQHSNMLSYNIKMDKNWFNHNVFIGISRPLLKLFIVTIYLLKKKLKKNRQQYQIIKTMNSMIFNWLRFEKYTKNKNKNVSRATYGKLMLSA